MKRPKKKNLIMVSKGTLYYDNMYHIRLPSGVELDAVAMRMGERKGGWWDTGKVRIWVEVLD